MRFLGRLCFSLGTVLLSSSPFLVFQEVVLESKGLDLSSTAGADQAIDERDVFCGLVQKRSLRASAVSSEAALEIPIQPFVFTNEAGTETTETATLRFDLRPGSAMKSLTQFALISTVAQTVDVMVGQNGFTFTPATVNITRCGR